MKVKDRLEDYVEYLVDYQGVRGLHDLTREERAKLSFFVLVDNFMYVKMIRVMHKLIKNAVTKNNQK